MRKLKMTKIKQSDAAIVFTASGGLEIIVPSYAKDDLVPQHALLCMALAALIDRDHDVSQRALDEFVAMANANSFGVGIQ